MSNEIREDREIRDDGDDGDDGDDRDDREDREDREDKARVSQPHYPHYPHYPHFPYAPAHLTKHHHPNLLSEGVRLGLSQKKTPRDSTLTYSPRGLTFSDGPRMTPYHNKLDDVEGNLHHISK